MSTVYISSHLPFSTHTSNYSGNEMQNKNEEGFCFSLTCNYKVLGSPAGWRRKAHSRGGDAGGCDISQCYLLQMEYYSHIFTKRGVTVRTSMDLPGLKSRQGRSCVPYCGLWVGAASWSFPASRSHLQSSAHVHLLPPSKPASKLGPS